MIADLYYLGMREHLQALKCQASILYYQEKSSSRFSKTHDCLEDLPGDPGRALAQVSAQCLALADETHP